MNKQHQDKKGKGKHTMKANITKIVAGVALAAIGFGANNAYATFADYFDGYSTPSLLDGQGGWGAAPGVSSTTAGIEVIAGSSTQSPPNVVRTTDNDADGHGIRHFLTEPETGYVSFKARTLVDNLNNNSGFHMQLNAIPSDDSYQPAAFFRMGFSPGGPDIQWFDGASSHIVPGAVSLNDWHQFDLYYDISSHANPNPLLRQSHVNTRVVNLNTLAVVWQTNLVYGSQVGDRSHIGDIQFFTGSTHQPSLFELDDVVIPEPSVVALMAAAGSILLLRFRRRG